MIPDNSCKIEVAVPSDAKLEQVQKAIDDALRSQWTDLTKCRETGAKAIIISSKFDKSAT
jgi:hypothetical protein